MAKIRQVKPAFFEDERICALREVTANMFIGLWTMCDDYGICPANPRQIKKELYYYRDEVDIPEIARRLQELEKAGRVIRFQVEGEQFLYVPTLTAHQYMQRPSVRPTISWEKMGRQLRGAQKPESYKAGRDFITAFMSTMVGQAAPVLENLTLFGPDHSIRRPELSTTMAVNSTRNSQNSGEMPEKKLHSQYTVDTQSIHHPDNGENILSNSIGVSIGISISDIGREPYFEKKEAKEEIQEPACLVIQPSKSPTTKHECREYFAKLSKSIWSEDFSNMQADDFFNWYESVGWITAKGLKIINWRPTADSWINRKCKELKDKQKVMPFRADPGMVAATGTQDCAKRLKQLYELFLVKGLTLEKIEPEHYSYLKHHGLLEISAEDQPDIIARACKIRAEQLLASNQRSNIVLAGYYEREDIDDPAVASDLKSFYRITRKLSVLLTFQRLKSRGQISIHEAAEAIQS